MSALLSRVPGGKQLQPVLLALAAILVTKAVAPKGLPNGIIVLGLLLGGLSALLAVGLLLVYRASRFVNFAQGPMGLFAGVLAGELVVSAHVNFWLAMLAGIAAGALIGADVERRFMYRLRSAPRVILMVASIGVTQVLAAATVIVPQLLHTQILDYHAPISAKLDIFPLRFDGDYLTIAFVVPATLLALAAFLRYSRYGMAIRAVAVNEERARTLGIPASRVSLIAWMIAGALSAVGGVLTIPTLGFSIQGVVQGPQVFLLAFAAAVMARMRNLWQAVVAALTLSVGYQAVFWNTAKSSSTDLMVLLAVLGALALQRGSLGREREAESATSWRAVTPVRPMPRSVTGLPLIRRAKALALTVMSVLAIDVLRLLSPSQAQLFGVVVIFALAALAVGVVSGFGGHITLGHWAIVGAGAFIGSTLVGRVPFLVGLPIVVLASALAAVLIGLPASRLTTLFYAVATYAFAVAAETVVFQLGIFSIDRPVDPPRILGYTFESNQSIAVLAMVFLVIAVLVVSNLRRATWGIELVATRENERVAASQGISVLRTRLAAYAVSGGISGLAGYLYLFNQHIIDAQSFAPDRSLMLLSMVVVGGLGSITGVLAGAVSLGVVQLYVHGAAQVLGTGIGLLVIVLLLPDGLSGLIYRVRDWLVVVVARNHGLDASGFVGGRRTGADGLRGPSETSDDTEPNPPVVLHRPTALTLREARQSMTVQRLGWVALLAGGPLWVLVFGTGDLLGYGNGASPGVARAVNVMTVLGVAAGAVAARRRPSKLRAHAALSLLVPALTLLAALTTSLVVASAALVLAAGLLGWLGGQAVRLAAHVTTGPATSAALLLIAAPLVAGSSLGWWIGRTLERHGAQSAEVWLTTCTGVAAFFQLLALSTVRVERARATSRRSHPVIVSAENVTELHPVESLLRVRGVEASYGAVQVLFGVDLDVAAGEIVALLGTNGAGKSTVLRTVSGFLRSDRGSIELGGEDVTSLNPEAITAKGALLVPGGRSVFPDMTVMENLRMGAFLTHPSKAAFDGATERILDQFPKLAARRSTVAGALSGGEQQMLAIAQALYSRPRLLMIDELSLGLAPVVVAELLDVVRGLAADGTGIILVEQSVNVALSIADRAFYLEKGEVLFHGPAARLLDETEILRSVFLEGAARRMDMGLAGAVG